MIGLLLNTLTYLNSQMHAHFSFHHFHTSHSPAWNKPNILLLVVGAYSFHNFCITTSYKSKKRLIIIINLLITIISYQFWCPWNLLIHDCGPENETAIKKSNFVSNDTFIGGRLFVFMEHSVTFLTCILMCLTTIIYIVFHNQVT